MKTKKKMMMILIV